MSLNLSSVIGGHSQQTRPASPAQSRLPSLLMCPLHVRLTASCPPALSAASLFMQMLFLASATAALEPRPDQTLPESHALRMCTCALPVRRMDDLKGCCIQVLGLVGELLNGSWHQLWCITVSLSVLSFLTIPSLLVHNSVYNLAVTRLMSEIHSDIHSVISHVSNNVTLVREITSNVLLVWLCDQNTREL